MEPHVEGLPNQEVLSFEGHKCVHHVLGQYSTYMESQRVAKAVINPPGAMNVPTFIQTHLIAAWIFDRL